MAISHDACTHGTYTNDTVRAVRAADAPCMLRRARPIHASPRAHVRLHILLQHRGAIVEAVQQNFKFCCTASTIDTFSATVGEERLAPGSAPWRARWKLRAASPSPSCLDRRTSARIKASALAGTAYFAASRQANSIGLSGRR